MVPSAVRRCAGRHDGIDSKLLSFIQQSKYIIALNWHSREPGIFCDPAFGPRNFLENSRSFTLLGGEMSLSCLYPHHQGQRPCCNIVGFKDAAVRRGPDFRVTLDAKHLVDKTAIGLGSGKQKRLAIL